MLIVPALIRPLLKHARPLPDSQPDLRPVLDGLREYVARLVEIVAGVEQAVERRAVLRPLLDLVEIPQIGFDRVVGFLFIPGGLALPNFIFRDMGAPRAQENRGGMGVSGRLGNEGGSIGWHSYKIFGMGMALQRLRNWGVDRYGARVFSSAEGRWS